MKKNLLSILMTAMLMCAGIASWAQTVLLVQEPANLAGSYNFTYSSQGAGAWGADMDTVAITAEAAFAYDDGTFVSPDGPVGDSLACGATINPTDIDGKIAVLYRGECDFSEKATNVQDSGAIALIIINNIPGGPVGMGAGASSAGVVIPVVMISDSDGAALRDSILAGAVTIFLGNNTGFYPYNVGTHSNKISIAKNFSTPKAFTEPNGDTLRLGVWIFNYGNQEATGVKMSAVIKRDGNEIYNDTTSGAVIPANGDSAYFTLPEVLLNDVGYYTLLYSVFADSTDEYATDNQAEVTFWINDSGIYSKSRVDPVEGALLSGTAKPNSDPWAEWEWCTAMQIDEANEQSITGVSFAMTTDDTATIDLTNKSVFVRIYEWSNYEPNGTSFGDLNELTDNEIYDYSENLYNEFITHTLAEPIDLIDDQDYLTCLFLDDEQLRIGYDAELDYSGNYNDIYVNQPVSPLLDYGEETWFILGFGMDVIPAIVTILSNPTGIAEDIDKREVTPFPNPTVDMINIPFGTALDGNVTLTVYDISGRLVMDQVLSLSNANQLRVDVTSLSSGLHTFNLRFEDDSTTSFKVIISK